MLIGTYALDAENFGLLAFLFPTWRVLKDPLNPFIPEKDVIVVTEKTKDPYPGKNVILITRRAETKLDSKEGFVKFLRDHGTKISEEQEKQLKQLEDGEFWTIAKQTHVTRRFQAPEVERTSTIFELFKNLFEDYGITYKLYRQTATNHRVIFSALLTMMLKTQQEDLVGASAGYKKALMTNRVYYVQFQKAVLNYLDSEMGEADFLTFLCELASAKRGGA